MPKSKISYENMVIYKICCKDLEIKECYVGQTTNLVQRRNKHKSNCNNEASKRYNLKVYQFIRENGSWDNWDVIEVDKCPCLDFEEACKIERYYIETLNATLNKNIPARTQKEYREDNKQSIAEKKKKSYYDNIDYIKEQRKIYRDNVKDIINEKAKDYRENNRDIIKNKAKEYYKKNKEIILGKIKEKVECECGCMINKSSLATHKKSQKHIKLMETKV